MSLLDIVTKKMATKTAELKVTANTASVEKEFIDLRNLTQKEFDKMSRIAKKHSKDVTGAFRSMGIKTDQTIANSTRRAKENYTKIKNSGTASAREIRKAHDIMTAKIKANNRELRGGAGRLSKAFSGLTRQIAGVAAAYAAIRLGTTAISESVKFESALIELDKVLSASEGTAEQYTDQIDALAAAYAVSAVEVLNGVAVFRQAGFAIEEALLLQASALKIVKVSELEAAEATELLTSVLKGFKVGAGEAERVVDILNAVSNKYATNFGELVKGMARFSPIAKKANLTFEETVAVLTPVIEVFRHGDEAANAMRTGLLNLVSDNPKVLGALEQLGVSQKKIVEGQEVMRHGVNILQDVQKAFVNVAQAEKLGITQRLTGIFQTGKMSEVFDGLNLTMQVHEDALKSTGSSQKELNKIMGSTEVKIGQMKVALAKTARIIGDELNPEFRKIVDLVTKSGTLILKVFFRLRIAQLEMQKAFINTAKHIAFVTDLLHITKNAGETVNVSTATLAKEIDVLKDRLNAAGKSAETFTRKNKKLAETQEDITDAVEATTGAVKDLAEETKKADEQALRDAELRVGAQESGLELRRLRSDAMRDDIRATEKELDELEDRLKDASDLVAAVSGIKAESAKRVEQKDLSEADKIIDDLNRAVEKFDTEIEGASNEVKAGIILAVANAIAAVQEIPEGTTKGLEDAKDLAADMQFEIDEMVASMEKAAQEAIPDVIDKLEAQNEKLEHSKFLYEQMLIDLTDLKIAAQDLKDKMNEDTKSTHTTDFVSTGGGNGEASPVGARTGMHIPGYGGGDTVPAMLEKGEFVHPKEAVRKLGLPAMYAIKTGNISKLLSILTAKALNRMDSQQLINRITEPTRKFQQAQGMQEGGMVGSGRRDMMDLNLSIPGIGTLKTSAPKKESDEFFKNLKQTNIIHGRYRRKY